MDNEIKAFVLQRSYYEASAGMAPEAKLAYLDGMIRYALYGEYPESLDKTGEAVFTAIKPAIDSSIERYQRAKANGSKGGRPSKLEKIDAKTIKTTA